VHHPAGRTQTIFLQNGHQVAVGVPVVNDDRQIEPPGQGQLLSKHLLLGRPGRKVAVIVQPHLSQRHDLGVSGQFRQCLQVAFRRRTGVMGVNADGGVDHFAAARQFDRRAGGFKAVPDIHDQPHACGPRPFQRRFPVGVIIIVV